VHFIVIRHALLQPQPPQLLRQIFIRNKFEEV